jgi:hypothetical protein
MGTNQWTFQAKHQNGGRTYCKAMDFLQNPWQLILGFSAKSKKTLSKAISSFSTRFKVNKTQSVKQYITTSPAITSHYTSAIHPHD